MEFLSLYYTHKPGGLCKRLYTLLQALERSHKTTYLSLDTPPANIKGFKKIWFPWAARRGALFWAVFSVMAAAQAVFVAIKKRPKILIAFHPFYALLLWPAALLSGGKIALFFRAVPHKVAEIRGEPWKGALLRICEYVAAKISKKVFLISNSMKAELPPIDDTKIHVIPNDLVKDSQVEGGSVLPASDRKFRIVSSGVFDARKNLEVLIEAVSLLAPKVQNQVCVYLVGDGEHRQKLEAMIYDRGLSEVFMFTGWIEGFSIPNVELVVHPALHEGLSNSLLEALGKKVAVLASNIPEHAEFFPRNALFASASELAEKIAACVINPGVVQEIIDNEDVLRANLEFHWEARVIQRLL
jgi:glycosyltransferase involved in cell wall biosynthesis